MIERKTLLALLKFYNNALRGIELRFNDTAIGIKKWDELENKYWHCLGNINGMKEFACALCVISNEERLESTLDLINKLELESE